jgi:uncharacterized RDD family membrane protein YckC
MSVRFSRLDAFRQTFRKGRLMNAPNPYAPPKTVVADPEDLQLGPNTLAGRGQRFGAAVLDALIAVIWSIPLTRYFNLLGYTWNHPAPLPTTLLVGVLSFAMFCLVNGYLLSKSGQTIGKKLVGIRIATLDGGLPELWKILVLRYGTLQVVELIPLVGPLFGIIDVLFIFRSDRRCLHDLIAGTKVVRGSSAETA